MHRGQETRTSSITSTLNSTGALRPSNSFPSFSIHSLWLPHGACSGFSWCRHLTVLRPRGNQVQDSKLYRGPDSSVLLHCSALSSNRFSQPSYPFLPSPSKLLGQCLSEFSTSHHGFNFPGSPQRVPGTRHQLLLTSSTSFICVTLPSCMDFLRREWLSI